MPFDNARRKTHHTNLTLLPIHASSHNFCQTHLPARQSLKLCSRNWPFAVASSLCFRLIVIANTCAQNSCQTAAKNCLYYRVCKSLPIYNLCCSHKLIYSQQSRLYPASMTQSAMQPSLVKKDTDASSSSESVGKAAKFEYYDVEPRTLGQRIAQIIRKHSKEAGALL